MKQLLMNLITNASEALGGESGTVTVTTGHCYCDSSYLQETFKANDIAEGNYVYVEVSDTGSGMSRETQKRIFEPFYSTKFTGRGLGLSAIQGIIKGHNGAIRVYSEEKEGSSFKVLLPTSTHSKKQLKEELKDRDNWRGQGLVLIVDDEPSIRQAASRMLRKIGFDVIAASNGAEGVESFREHSERVVCTLLDLTMPVMDGKEAFRRIRHIKSDAKIILTSGYNEQEATQVFAGRGLAGFIQKPYRLANLKKLLKEILSEPPPSGS